jgi:hypothetical protein
MLTEPALWITVTVTALMVLFLMNEKMKTERQMYVIEEIESAG